MSAHTQQTAGTTSAAGSGPAAGGKCQLLDKLRGRISASKRICSHVKAGNLLLTMVSSEQKPGLCVCQCHDVLQKHDVKLVPATKGTNSLYFHTIIDKTSQYNYFLKPQNVEKAKKVRRPNVKACRSEVATDITLVKCS